MSTWQRDFIDWHVRTDHPWDTALQMEAMALGFQAISATLRDGIQPAIERLAAELRKLSLL